MFSKKPSFEQESPLQDLSVDQLSEVAGGCDSSYNKSANWKKEWEKKHHHHHKTTTTPTQIEIIITENGTTKKYYEHW